MRIRLLIERNELPAVSVLWSFPSTQLTNTVAQFLENVNIRFPLEGNTWGLEDYTVSLGGYEAQHYSKVGEVFKEDDEVVIKPLMFAEARTRAITGRSQITSDGRKLFDGVPFGKPLLKRMRRPDLDIPPDRKRAKMLEDVEVEEQRNREMGVVARIADSDDEDDDEDYDEEEDSDFEDRRTKQVEVVLEEEIPYKPSNTDSSRANRKGLKNFGLKLGSESDDDEDEDDGDFEDEDAEQDSSDDSSDSSDSDSDSSSSDSDDEADGAGEEEKDDGDSSSDSSSSNTTWIGIDAGETATPAEAPEPPPALPHQGKARTKERNVRRREAARLKHLKKTSELPSSATLQQMQDWLRTGELPQVSDTNAEDSQKSLETSKKQHEVDPELERKRQQLISDINGGGIEVPAEPKNSRTAAVPTNMHPPQVKKSKKKSKSFTPLDDDDRPEEIPIATEPVVVYPVIPQASSIPGEDPAAIASQSAATEGPKRVSAAQRLIYGSLGLRAPKTQADKDALQKKLTDRSKKSTAEVPAEEQEVEDEDPEAWREKVVISAVECLDEGVELSEPPFPFQQRWDPQYWSQNIKKRNASRGGEGGRKKKRKNNGGAGEVVEVYDKYNRDGGGDALNYDDPVDEDEDEEEWDDGENWQDGALLDAEEEEEDDGFPALPEDVTTLASLSEADAQPSDFVVFTEMACSDATGWQPQIVTTVACLDSRGDGGGWNLRFSKRGGQKEYDDQGNRVYKKFEMEGFDDEAEDDMKQVEWAEMMDVKLLRRPDVVEEQLDGDVVVEQTVGGGVDEQIQSQLETEMGREASSVDQ